MTRHPWRAAALAAIATVVLILIFQSWRRNGWALLLDAVMRWC